MDMVKYARNARRVAPYMVRSTPAYRYAKAAQTMYNIGKRAAPYANAAIDAWKARPRKKTKYEKKADFQSRLGEPVGTATAKRNGFSVAKVTTQQQQQLASVPLISLIKSSTDALDGRSRDIVNFRGVKICFYAKNKKQSGEPIYLNWAIISPKDSSAASLVADDFFRGDGASRAINFSNTLSWMDTRCMPINTDKYNVLHHRRLVLDGVWNVDDTVPGTANDTINLGTKGTVFFEKYIPINRQLRFDATAATPTTPNVFMVYWYQAPDELNTVKMESQYKVVQYFKEPSDCC